MVAKVASDQAKPTASCDSAGAEAAFLAPLEVRRIPGVGKVTEARLHALGIRKVGDLARLDEAFIEGKFGKWGLALAGKSKGFDAGGWFDSEIGAEADPKSISHEHTFDVDTADTDLLEATLARLSVMVGRRLREHACTPGLFSSSCATRTSPPSRAPSRSIMPPAWTPNCWRPPACSSAGTGNGEPR